LGSVRFGAPRELVAALARQFGRRTFVETGTHLGGTAAWAAGVFERVVTIEGAEALHRVAAGRLRTFANVEAIHGHSGDVLARLGEAPAPLYWLDAHWCGEGTHGATAECPVLAEIAAIARHTCDPFLLIDDARLFLAPPPPPHRADDWPAIGPLLAALDAAFPGGYTVVVDDVIVRVPLAARPWLLGCLQDAAQRETEDTRRRSRTLRGRLTGRLRRFLEPSR
jgi:hypothetical protein